LTNWIIFSGSYPSEEGHSFCGKRPYKL